MNWFDKILETFKLLISTRVLLGLFISSCVLLFFSQYLAILKIDTITLKYGEIIGTIFIVSLAMLIADLIILVRHKVSQYLTSGVWKRRKIKRAIRLLTNSQKAILREFFIQESKLIKLPVNNPDVSSLIEREILESSGVFQANLPVGIIKYANITYYANELLNFKSIGWPEGPPTKKESIAIQGSRPKFIYSIEAR